MKYFMLDHFLMRTLAATAKDDDIYDITEIPYFPFTPGVASWISFAALAIAFTVAAHFFFRSTNKRILQGAYNEVIRVLDQTAHAISVANSITCKEYLARAALSVKRLVTRFESVQIATASEAELATFRNTTASTSLRDLCDQLIVIETFKYQPHVQLDESAQLINKLKSALLAYGESKLHMKEN